VSEIDTPETASCSLDERTFLVAQAAASSLSSTERELLRLTAKPFDRLAEDESHSRFHRHEPGWPLPGGIEAYLDSVEPRLRIEFARREIALRYPEYEAALFGKDLA
jgi:hypothetical protein